MSINPVFLVDSLHRQLSKTAIGYSSGYLKRLTNVSTDDCAVPFCETLNLLGFCGILLIAPTNLYLVLIEAGYK